MTTPTNFHITLEEDAATCLWYWDIVISHWRTLRISVSEFDGMKDINGAPTSQKSRWVYFKLFKFKDSDEVPGQKKHQQVCFRPVEAKRLLQALPHIQMLLLTSMSIKHEELDLSPSVTFPVSSSIDISKSHWFMDVFETPRRRTRASYVMYQPNDPINSTYIQFKLLSRKLTTDEFCRKSQVSITMAEFTKLHDQCDQLQIALKDYLPA